MKAPMMQPGAVRERILNDHQELRRELDRLEALGSGAAVELVRQRLAALLGMLRSHIELEDAILLPALREADEWGPYRAAELERHHREQHTSLDAMLAACADGATGSGRLMEILRDLMEELRRDMAHEERAYLAEEILSDSIVAANVETG